MGIRVSGFGVQGLGFRVFALVLNGKTLSYNRLLKVRSVPLIITKIRRKTTH